MTNDKNENKTSNSKNNLSRKETQLIYYVRYKIKKKRAKLSKTIEVK
jgi:hypothetical protein